VWEVPLVSFSSLVPFLRPPCFAMNRPFSIWPSAPLTCLFFQSSSHNIQFLFPPSGPSLGSFSTHSFFLFFCISLPRPAPPCPFSLFPVFNQIFNVCVGFLAASTFFVILLGLDQKTLIRPRYVPPGRLAIHFSFFQGYPVSFCVALPLFPPLMLWFPYQSAFFALLSRQ